jgi:hypothetical protein
MGTPPPQNYIMLRSCFPTLRLSLSPYRPAQYKLRFRKWNLPSIRPPSTSPMLVQTVGSGHRVSTQQPPPTWPLPAPPNVGITSGEGKRPVPSLEIGSKSASESSDENVEEKDSTLPANEVSFDHSEPDYGQDPLSSIPEQTPSLESDPMQEPSLLKAIKQKQEARHIHSITPQALLNAAGSSDLTDMLSVEDLQHIADCADYLYVVGSYQAAHDLQMMISHTLLKRNRQPLPLFLYSTISIARCASNGFQLLNEESTLEKLLELPTELLEYAPWAKLTMYAHLADASCKLKRMKEIEEYSAKAFQAFAESGYDLADAHFWKDSADEFYHHVHPVEDNDFEWDEPAFVAHNCSRRCKLKQLLSWRIDATQGDALRPLFIWCTRLILKRELHKRLSDSFQSLVLVRDCKHSIIRGLRIIVFCYFWTTYIKLPEIQHRDDSEYGQDIPLLVSKVKDAMGIGAAHMFASISQELVRLGWSNLIYGDIGARRFPSDSTWQSFYTGMLLRCAQSQTSTLVPASQWDVIPDFVPAYNGVGPPRIPQGFLELPYVKTAILEHSVISLSFSALQQATPADINSLLIPHFTAFHASSIDAAMTQTPRSSKSSLNPSLRAIRQVARRIVGRKNSIDALSCMSQTCSTSSSWSLRHHLGLSTASYRTLSTDDNASVRESAMDWEPT